MKRSKILTMIAALLLSGTAFAQVNFSAVVAGTVGVSGNWEKGFEFGIPLSANAKAQINFGNWGVFRGDLNIASPNLANMQVFKNSELNSYVKVNEISFVLNKGANDVMNYFGFYLGTYEAVGCDAFLQRQFGIAPISSSLTKSSSTLSSGYSLYDNYGLGFSYVLNFGKTPAAFGVNLYFDMADAQTVAMNLDLRTAFTFAAITMDAAVGIGAPLQTKYNNQDVILLIDTLYLHGGISVLLGNKYTHSLLLQGGVQNIKITPNGTFASNFSADDLSALAEVRIYSKPVKFRITAFNLPKETAKETLYIDDAFGAGFTVIFDSIPLKNETDMTFGIHLTGSFPEKTLVSLLTGLAGGENFAQQKINAAVTPYVIIPLFGGNLEIMGQIGLANILNQPTGNFKAKVGFKREF